MNRYICILRGINVGGHRKILMKDLITLLEKNGYVNVKTYIQSGNIALNTKFNLAIEIEESITGLINSNYGFDVPVIAVTKGEVEKVIKNLPFDDEENTHVTFLKSMPLENDLNQIIPEDFLPEKLVISGKMVYLKCVDKYHKSKLSNQLFEKKLKVSATTRNWKTVKKLLELAEA